MPVVIYQYDAAGQQTGTKEKKLNFPQSYNKGSFVLTLIPPPLSGSAQLLVGRHGGRGAAARV